MADVHGFKHKRTAQVLSDIANREQATRADLTAERGKPDVAQSRHYWVWPSENIAAATDRDTPTIGKFYLYYLNRELATPKLERWQFNGVDVEVDVSSYLPHALTAESGPKYRAEEDMFGELSVWPYVEQAVLTTQFQDVNYFDTVAVDVWESDGDIAISTQAIEAVSTSGYLKLLTPGRYRIQTVIEFETGSHDEAGTYGAYFWPFAEYLFRHKMFKDDFSTVATPTTGSTYNCGGVFTQPPDYRNYSLGFARERYAQTVVVESNFEFETMPAGTDYVVVQLFAQTSNTTAFNSEKAHVERSHTHAWKI